MVLLVAACGGGGDRAPRLRVDGHGVILDGTRPLRALRVDLEWDASLSVTGIAAGADAERMNLIRVDMAGNGARVLLADTRRLQLPPRGELLHVEAAGEGAIRIVDVEAAENGGRLVEVEVE